MKRFTIHSENGRLILCDATLKYLESVDIDKDAYERNYVSLLSGEGDFIYDIGIVSELNDTRIANYYKRENGYFGINVDSGKLVLLSENEWTEDKKVNKIFLDSGSYRASVLTYSLEDYSEYRDDLVSKIGEKNMKHYEFVDKIGLFAWGVTIISIILLFTDIGQDYWFILLLCWFFSWYLFSKCLKTDKYQKIDRIRIKCENKFPHYIIYLEPSNVNIPGGTQYLYT